MTSQFMLHIFFLLQTQLLHMVRNTSKPLEGLKALLFHLFSPDEVRQSSLKGRTTVAGGETVGLQKENLDLIYCKFKIDVTCLSIVCKTHSQLSSLLF